jgi:hypothetical protein
VDPVPDPLLFFFIVPGIEPGPSGSVAIGRMADELEKIWKEAIVVYLM